MQFIPFATETLAFDATSFESTYATQLTAEPDVNGWLQDFKTRKASIGAGFETDKGCQALCGKIEKRKVKWDRVIAAAAWKTANPGAHAAWMTTNAALIAAGAPGERDT
ncbi:hypothetical protein LCGC14_1271240 [marine sediment metagenome]|uniref:Uncharacterized protein n=1 Tax=marine sediment metagenome TaxID=412755 RepID=A0A0F9LJ25_9ZZZZ